MYPAWSPGHPVVPGLMLARCAGMGVGVTFSAGSWGAGLEGTPAWDGPALWKKCAAARQHLCLLVGMSPHPQVPSLLQQHRGLGPQPSHDQIFLSTGSSSWQSPGPHSHPARPRVGTGAVGGGKPCSAWPGGWAGPGRLTCRDVLAPSSGSKQGVSLAGGRGA